MPSGRSTDVRAYQRGLRGRLLEDPDATLREAFLALVRQRMKADAFRIARKSATGSRPGLAEFSMPMARRLSEASVPRPPGHAGSRLEGAR